MRKERGEVGEMLLDECRVAAAERIGEVHRIPEMIEDIGGAFARRAQCRRNRREGQFVGLRGNGRLPAGSREIYRRGGEQNEQAAEHTG